MDLRASVEAKLRSAGVRLTPQRIEIGMLLLAGPCHSADQILSQLRDAGRPVCKATIYNTLNLFSRRGIIREVAVNPSRLVYDSTTEFHHHFYNDDTGELTDIDPAELEIKKLPRLPRGTEAHGVELIVRLKNKPKS